MNNGNTITVLTWGDFACFTRPELKVERVTYPILTPSAARGILEAIFWEPQMRYLIREIAVARHTTENGTTYGRGSWVALRRNEVQSVISIAAAKSWMKGTKPAMYIAAGAGAADYTQRNTLALRNVAYLITAEIALTDRAQPPTDNLRKYLDSIRDRATKGKCYHRPCLGCREFAADFDWIHDPATVRLEDWSEDLGLMLYDVFDPDASTAEHVVPRAVFFEASVRNGRMDCHPDRVQLHRAQTQEAN